jgi:transcriptional antiterminator NusG
VIDEANELAKDAVVTDPSETVHASTESVPSPDTNMPESNMPDTNMPDTNMPVAIESDSPSDSAASAASEVSETPEPPQDESSPDDTQQSEISLAEETGKAEAAETEEEVAGPTVAEGKAADDAIEMDWYILKVQSNREKSITEALERRVKIAGLDEYFEQVVVPTEKVTEFKGGRKRVVNRKLYPGYILVHMHINDDTWFLVRETPGIGDFTGSGGKPTPMLAHEVQRIIVTEEEQADEAPKLKISFIVGDRVKINEGTFESFEGEVSSVDQTSGHITVMINIFGRSTPVELEYWQAEAV